VKAGCDVVLMPESKQAAANALLEAVADGTLSEARINESVLRILSLKYEYGIIE
jgi:beta-N-acetylhexosaminidase